MTSLREDGSVEFQFDWREVPEICVADDLTREQAGAIPQQIAP